MADATAEIVVWGVGTARTMRVHWALHELGVPYETRPIQSRSGETQTPEYRAINPREKIPAIVHGDLTLVESAAIVTHLGETFGAGKGFVPPPATRERALYDQWCFFVMTELDAHSLYVLRRHGDLADLYGEAPNALSAARAYFGKQSAVAAETLSRAPYLLGERFTGADLLLGSCLSWAVFYGIPLSGTLDEYRERLCARDAYHRAFEANFPPDVMQALLAQRAEANA